MARKWKANVECAHNIKRQWTISFLEVRYYPKQNISPGTIKLHWNICQDHDIKVIDKWYEHKPESVTHNKDSKITIMWDMPVHTDRTITGNRPDVNIKDSVHLQTN